MKSFWSWIIGTAAVILVGVAIFALATREHPEPVATTVTTTSATVPPVTRVRPPTATPAPPTPHQPKLAAQDYVVKPGDTLWKISGHFANIPGWYPAIANASWVKNPNLIRPGQVLHIPEIP